MDFRFPHPFENVVDAIKDAADPDTPEDGSLAIQLMNENNRAVEDRLAEQVLDTVYDTQTGEISGTASSFDMVTTLPREGLWQLNVTAYIEGNTPDGPPDFAYAYMDVAGDAGLVSIENPILLVDDGFGDYTIKARWSTSVLYNADTELDITTTLGNGLGNTCAWDTGITSRLQLWGVRLGPVSPGLD